MQPTIEALPRAFDVFMSHNSAEKAAVEELSIKLRELGLKPWLDKWQLVPSSVWQDELDKGLRSSKSCAIFIGPGGITHWQLQEMRVAQVLHAEQQPFQVIPVILPGGDGKNFPLFIRSNFNWVDFRTGLDNPTALEQLARSIRGDEEPPPNSEVGSNICPFKGLDAYKEEDAEFFFGREIFVEQRLVEHLRKSRFLAVVGMSGSGKSSVVRAGLIPALRRGALLGKETSPVLTMKPGARPLEELAVQLLPLLNGVSLRMIIEDLKASERSLHLAFRSAQAERHLLVIDQFEEIFTLTQEEEERQAFFKNLVYAATLSDSPLLIVITMRSDFLSKCAHYRDINALICENLEQVPYMSQDELRRAITEPARRAELKFQLGLVDLILKDVGNSSNSLPLLQHSLLELWQKRRENTLATTVYEEMGGVQGGLAKHAERIFTEMPADQQRVVQRMFMRLVTLGEGTEDTRRRAAKHELLQFGETANKAIESLIGDRLLTASTDGATGEETIEVVHEALIRSWPRLTEWINADRNFNRFRQKLTDDAVEWNERGRTEAEVYRGGQLEEATAYLNDRAEDLTELEKEFIRAAAAHHEAEIAKEKKRFTFLRRLFVIAAIGFVGAGIAAYIANDLRKVSRSKELGLRVLSMPDENPRTLLAMAIEAFESSPTDEAQEALRSAVQLSNEKKVIGGFASDVSSVSFMPDGKSFLLTQGNGDCSVHEASTGKLRTKYPWKASDMRFMPDGTHLMVRQGDSDLAIRTLADGKTDRTIHVNTPIGVFSLSTDGNLLLIAGTDSTARIIDVASGIEAWKMKDDSGRIQHAVFNRDGSRFVTQSFGVSRFRYAPYDVRLFDGASHREIAHLRSNSRRMINNVVFSPDGKKLVTFQDGSGLQGMDDPKSIPLLEVWDAITGKLDYRIMNISDWEVYMKVQFSSDGKLLLVTRNKNAVIYDALTGAELMWLRGHTDQIRQAGFIDSGKRVLTFANDATARLWDATSGALITTLRGHRSTAKGVAISSDYNTLATYGGDSTVWIYGRSLLNDYHSNAELFAAKFESPLLEEGEAIVTDAGRVMMFPYNGRSIKTFDVFAGTLVQDHPLGHQIGMVDANLPLNRLTAIETNGNVSMMDLRTWQWRQYGKCDSGYQYLNGLTDDNSRIVVWSITRDWAIFGPNGKEVLKLADAKAPMDFATISPDGKHLISFPHSDSVFMLDPATGKITHRYGKDHRGAPWYGYTGRWLMIETPDVVNICKPSTGEIVATVEFANTTSFDQDREGKLCALAGRDKSIGLVDIEHGKLKRTIRGLENTVNTISLSLDGSKVIANESNGTSEVFETETGKRIAILRGYKGTVQNASFSPNGRMVVTRGTKVDGSCRVFYVYPEDVLELAKKKLAAMAA